MKINWIVTSPVSFSSAWSWFGILFFHKELLIHHKSMPNFCWQCKYKSYIFLKKKLSHNNDFQIKYLLLLTRNCRPLRKIMLYIQTFSGLGYRFAINWQKENVIWIQFHQISMLGIKHLYMHRGKTHIIKIYSGTVAFIYDLNHSCCCTQMSCMQRSIRRSSSSVDFNRIKCT